MQLFPSTSNAILHTYGNVKPVVTIVASMDQRAMKEATIQGGEEATIAYNAVFRRDYYCIFGMLCE